MLLIFYAYFVQGASISLFALLNYSGHLAGAVPLNGYVPLKDSLDGNFAAVASRATSGLSSMVADELEVLPDGELAPGHSSVGVPFRFTPIYLTYGKIDSLVLPFTNEETAEVLRAWGAGRVADRVCHFYRFVRCIIQVLEFKILFFRNLLKEYFCRVTCCTAILNFA